MTPPVKQILSFEADRNVCPTRKRRAFTLTELLVVIAIIIIMLALAVPLFNIMHGGRSVDASENIVSSMLQRARARAIWTQEQRGVFFFHDQGGSGKTAMLMVRVQDDGTTLDLDQDNTELEFLPTSIDAAFMHSPTSTTPAYVPFGLVLFDGQGRTESEYPYRVKDPAALITQYGVNIGPASSGSLAAGKEYSSVAITLFDNTKLNDVGGVRTDTTYSPEQIAWLDQNGLALVVNRYNGTLFRGE